ncbi:MAG: cytochrome c-type biogenesis protein, partial [Pseudomonadota bacterium]
MHRLAVFSLALIAMLAIGLPAQAVNPDEVLSDPVLEQRARNLSIEIRCLVCQNQSIDDSDAELARDLRVLVREQLVEGKTDQEILEYLVTRYGEFVLLRPRLGWHTVLLWGLPALIFAIGILGIWRFFSNRVGFGENPTVQLSKS